MKFVYMRINRESIRIVFTLYIVMISSCSSKLESFEKIISIKEARKSPPGRSVTVTGSVTVPSGAFSSSITSGFAIQDSSAGIYINDSSSSVEVGETITVTGFIGEEYGQKNINLKKIFRKRNVNLPVARLSLCREIGEDLEGSLVLLNGTISKVQDDAPYGYKIFLVDESDECLVFINKTTELYEKIQRWKPNSKISVEGIVGEYRGVYEVLPRKSSDIK
jgi:hypothetical protein